MPNLAAIGFAARRDLGARKFAARLFWLRDFGAHFFAAPNSVVRGSFAARSLVAPSSAVQSLAD